MDLHPGTHLLFRHSTYVVQISSALVSKMLIWPHSLDIYSLNNVEVNNSRSSGNTSKKFINHQIHTNFHF